MSCPLILDGLNSSFTSTSLGNEYDAFSALWLNDGSDSSATVHEEGFFLENPPVHVTFASIPQDSTSHFISDTTGRPLLDIGVEPWLELHSFDQPERPSDSLLQPNLLGLYFTSTSVYAHDNSTSLMTTAPPCVDPAVLSFSPSREVAHSPQSVTSSEEIEAGPSCIPEGLLRSARRAEASSSSSLSSTSDVDAGGDADSDTSDYDYVPSSSRRAGKRRYNPYEYKTSQRLPHDIYSVSPPSSPTPSSSSTPHIPYRRARRRNVQVDALPSTFEDALTNGSCKCPVPGCRHIQINRRVPDLRRHMRTHCARASRETWVCCGVFLADAPSYGIRDASETYTYKGFTMIGGCLKSFSRKDALIRHLRNDDIGCRGDADLAKSLSRD